MLDRTVEQNTHLRAILVEYAETQCEALLSSDQGARVMDHILIAISSDVDSMSEAVIDSLIQSELADGCTGAGHR